MGDENPICTLGYYSKPSHKGYRNTIELPVGNKVVPLLSDTIRLVQNGCSFHGLRSEDPNQYLDGENRERTRLCPNPQPQTLGTTFKARVWDYMAAHTERMERFENAIFKQREEINDMEVLVNEAETKNGAESEAKNKLIKKPKKEEVVEAPSSRPVEYYLKHMINEKLIEGLVDNNRFNNSLLGARAGKKKGKTYNVLPREPVYEAILKKKITKKEDIGGNFEIPCSIGGLRHVNTLVDQGSDVNIIPYSTYMKLTNERLAETEIRLSLASH
ncbi:hypothetical protein Tco_0368473 [Tanacetum coccineum]